jgi:hypothetical protein
MRQKFHKYKLTSNRFGSISFVALLGFVLAFYLFALALWAKDGMALLADTCLSLPSTIVLQFPESRI